MTVARRVAAEVGCEIGDKVGYTIRFEDHTSPATQIKYMTDGILLREAMADPLLSKYNVICVDEAHERTVQADILLGLLKGIQQRRGNAATADQGSKKRKRTARPLKIVVMSATLQAESFSNYFGGCRVLYVEGRTFDVKLLYTQDPQPDYLEAALTCATQIHLDEAKGDILVFLTGQEEIETAQQLLEERSKLFPPETDKLLVCPIFAALPPEQQMEAFAPTPGGCRKVILATNIAETSITINGIRYVVDTGVHKSRVFHAKVGIDSLCVTPISQAAANQRTGRAGREAAGTCYRLYTEPTFGTLEGYLIPEIQRTNLANVCLQLKAPRRTRILRPPLTLTLTPTSAN